MGRFKTTLDWKLIVAKKSLEKISYKKQKIKGYLRNMVNFEIDKMDPESDDFKNILKSGDMWNFKQDTELIPLYEYLQNKITKLEEREQILNYQINKLNKSLNKKLKFI
jgi:chaperonin cofactor prefoldin